MRLGDLVAREGIIIDLPFFNFLLFFAIELLARTSFCWVDEESFRVPQCTAGLSSEESHLEVMRKIQRKEIYIVKKQKKQHSPHDSKNMVWS